VGPGRSARQDLRGARPVELREILCRVHRQDGLTIGIGVVVQRAVAAQWWYAVLDRSAGGPAGARTGLVGGSRMVKTGRLLWANRPSLRQPSARWAGREPELAAGVKRPGLDGRL
jgi:hypothetical protein